MQASRPLTVSRKPLLVGGSDAAFRTMLHDFMVYARRVEAIRDVLAAALGVTPPQYEILSHVRENQSSGGLSIGAIAARLHCSGAFITTEIGKLVLLSLVSKVRDPLDARKVIVRNTTRCEARMRALASLQSELNDRLFASVNAQQFGMLCDLLPQLVIDGDQAAALATYREQRSEKQA